VLVRGAAYRARASPTAAAASTAPTRQRTTPTPRHGCAARRPAAPSADAPPGTCAPPRRACGAPARRAPRRPSASATRPRGGSACSCALAGGHYGCGGGCAACSRVDPVLSKRLHLTSPQPIPTPPPAPDQGCTVRGMALTAAAMVALPAMPVQCPLEVPPRGRHRMPKGQSWKGGLARPPSMQASSVINMQLTLGHRVHTQLAQ